jgi:hypothetical protein
MWYQYEFRNSCNWLNLQIDPCSQILLNFLTDSVKHHVSDMSEPIRRRHISILIKININILKKKTYLKKKHEGVATVWGWPGWPRGYPSPSWGWPHSYPIPRGGLQVTSSGGQATPQRSNHPFAFFFFLKKRSYIYIFLLKWTRVTILLADVAFNKICQNF